MIGSGFIARVEGWMGGQREKKIHTLSDEVFQLTNSHSFTINVVQD